MKRNEFDEVLFRQFYYKNRGFINKILSKYNLSYQEQESECAYVYVANPEIEDLLISGEERQAFSEFASRLRKSAFETYADTFSTNDTPTKQKAWMMGIVSLEDATSDLSLEEKMYRCELLDRLKRSHKDDYDFSLRYYQYGPKKLAALSNLSESGVRKKLSRALNRLRNSIPRD